MQSYGEIVVGGIAGVATLVVALYVTAPEPKTAGRAGAPATEELRARDGGVAPLREGAPRPAARVGAEPGQRGAPAAGGAPEGFGALRNRVIDETGRGMQRRKVSVMDCLVGATLVGTQKLRFAVHVSATPMEAIVGPWRFVEIVEGQPLPDGFPACAEAALGEVGRLGPGAEGMFPRHEGELSTIYWIEAPAGEEPREDRGARE